jgi:hypothetical protein
VRQVLFTGGSVEVVMSSFEEKLARAKNAPRKFTDVQVAFDADVAERRVEIEQQMLEASKDARLTAAPAEGLQEELDALLEREHESLTTFRFYRLPGREWAECIARNPVRIDAPLDRQYGYNFHGACRFAAIRSGYVLEGDGEAELSTQQWDDVWSTLSGSEVTALTDAIWELNEWGPAARLTDLKKSSAVAPATAQN